jgi:hypothetical protein
MTKCKPAHTLKGRSDRAIFTADTKAFTSPKSPLRPGCVIRTAAAFHQAQNHWRSRWRVGGRAGLCACPIVCALG